MFKNDKIKKLEEENVRLSNNIEVLKDEAISSERIIKELNKKIEELKQENKENEREFNSDKKILLREKEVEISKAIEESQKTLVKTQQENAVLKKEVEVLEKAFENMGLDVKDMKDILSKLVDGIVLKNQVQLIK